MHKPMYVDLWFCKEERTKKKVSLILFLGGYIEHGNGMLFYFGITQLEWICFTFVIEICILMQASKPSFEPKYK
jgi:hypothetical protein